MIYCNVSVLLAYIWTYNGGNLFLSPNIYLIALFKFIND